MRNVSVLVVAHIDQDNIENVVKHNKLCSRGYLASKSVEKFSDMDCCTLMEKNGEGIVKSYLQLFISISWKRLQRISPKNSDILANNFKALADGITPHDIAPYITHCSLHIIYQTNCRININVQTGNDVSTLNNFKTIVDTAVLRYIKPWFLIDWIFNATEVGKKYNEVVKCELGKIMRELEKKKRMRENTHTTGVNDEKPSLMDLLIDYADIGREEIVGEITYLLTPW